MSDSENLSAGSEIYLQLTEKQHDAVKEAIKWVHYAKLLDGGTTVKTLKSLLPPGTVISVYRRDLVAGGVVEEFI